MEGAGAYEPNTYGDRIAELYDELFAEVPFSGDAGRTASFLASIADRGPALELGIGTGRVALPLQELGVEVHGVDASEAMVARLRAKPGGARIAVTIADFRELGFDRRYPLIYVVFNTFFGLLTQDDQVACFAAIARRLTDEGAFVMEAFVPDLGRFDRGQRVAAIDVGTDAARLEVTRHDPIEQRVESQHVILREGGVRLFPVRIRYATVAELDLMARLAGLRLRERWAEWDRTPFGPGAAKHISVWEPGDPATAEPG